MKRPDQLQTILWDWNGTLFDDGDFGVHIVNSMLRKRQLPELDRDGHARIFDFPVERYYERLGFDFTAESFEQLSHEFVATYYAGVHRCKARPHAREALQTAQDAGLAQFVLSATHQDFLQRLVEQTRFADFFDGLLGIDSVHAPGKIDRGCQWIAETGQFPSTVLLIGDTVHDAEVADAMGIPCWLVEGGHHPLHRLQSTNLPVFPDLAAISEALANQF